MPGKQSYSFRMHVHVPESLRSLLEETRATLESMAKNQQRTFFDNESFAEQWDKTPEAQRAWIMSVMSDQMEMALLQRLLNNYSVATPSAYVAHHTDHGNEWMLSEEQGIDFMRQGPLYRRRYETIGPPAGHENCRCWLDEESTSGEIHVKGERCYLVATRTQDPVFPSWSHPLEPLRFDIGAFLIHLDGQVTTHVLKQVRWDDMHEIGHKVPIEQGQEIIEYPNLREWLEGLARDIDRHTLQGGMARKKMLDELAGGAECDVIKWAQTHRTPKETVEAIRSAGIAITMSHSEPWEISRQHPDAVTQLGMGFVAICGIGQGELAIKELRKMGYPCRLLRRGKPDIPALVGLDEQILRALDVKEHRAYLRLLGKHNRVHEDDIPQIEV